MKKIIITTLLVTVLILLFNWITDFNLFHFEDLKLFVVLVLGTTIFMMLHKKQIDLPQRYRFYLFLTAILMTLMLVYDSLISLEEDPYKGILLCFRPIIYGTILYFPGDIILQQLPIDENNEAPWQTALSRRESEVYELVKTGKTNRQISEELYIAETTVKKHVQNIMKKAGHNNRDAL